MKRIRVGGLMLLAALAFVGLATEASAQCALIGQGCATVPAPNCNGGCGPAANRFLSHPNFYYGAELGGFDLSTTDFASTCCDPTACATPGIPPLRYWAYDQYMVANSGCQSLFIPPPVGDCFIANGVTDIGLGITPGVWLLYQAQWSSATGSGPDRIDGCITTDATFIPPDTSNRTVVEMSWGDSTSGEGTPAHQAYYIVASVEEAGGAFPFDNIQGATGTQTPGAGSATMAPQLVPDVLSIALPAGPAQACTASVTAALVAGRENAADANFFDIDVTVSNASPDYLTDAGLSTGQQLIAGLQIMYASGSAPTTGDAASYLLAGDVATPSNAAGIIAFGGGTTATVSLPNAGAPHYLAARIVYWDGTVNSQTGPGAPGTAPILGSWNGGSCGGAVPPSGGLAVTFDSVDAIRTPNGVQVVWSTAFEDDVLGFTVHRADNPTGIDAIEANVPWTDAKGAYTSYEVIDSAVATDATAYWYYVQEFTSNGPGDKSPIVKAHGLQDDGYTGGRSRTSR